MPSKKVDCHRCAINLTQEIGFRDDTEDLSLDALMDELDILMREMCEDYQKNGLLGIKRRC